MIYNVLVQTGNQKNKPSYTIGTSTSSNGGKPRQKYVRLKKRPSGRRIFFSLFAVLILAIIAIGIRTAMAINTISADSGGFSTLVKSFPRVNTIKLKGEEQGRVNILLIGIGGKGHKGGQLADTIIILSINTITNQVALLSIPRDMYVPIPNQKGSYEKVNAIHTLGETFSKYKSNGGGPKLLANTLGEILKIELPYYVRVDFGGFEKIIDSLGGVDIVVDKPINDPFYPAKDMIHYDPFYLKSGPTHMDGKVALKFVRSRKTSSDFDRARRQQKLISSLKKKLAKPQVIANPVTLNRLIGIIQDSLKTNISVSEFRRLTKIAGKLDSDSIISRVIDSSPKSPLAVGRGEGYFLVPRKGLNDYSQVAKIAQTIFNDNISFNQK